MTVDLENKPEEFVELYAKANPLPGARAKVPLLEVEGVALTESLAVAEFIAESYSEANLQPASAINRYVARLFTELCSSSFSYFPILRARGDKRTAAAQAFRQDMVAVNAFLESKGSSLSPFLLDSFSLAECNLAPFVQRACMLLPELTREEAVVVNPLAICDELGLDRLKKWIEAVLSRPSVTRTGVPQEQLIDRTGKMLERFAAMDSKSLV